MSKTKANHISLRKELKKKALRIVQGRARKVLVNDTVYVDGEAAPCRRSVGLTDFEWNHGKLIFLPTGKGIKGIPNVPKP